MPGPKSTRPRLPFLTAGAAAILLLAACGDQAPTPTAAPAAAPTAAVSPEATEPSVATSPAASATEEPAAAATPAGAKATPIPASPMATPIEAVTAAPEAATPEAAASPRPAMATPVAVVATEPPPTETPEPTETAVPPTATPAPPTATPVPPTATPVPPTNTPVPPTETPVPPTNTPVPPTNTPVPPTSTPVPPTNTPAPPTNTPVPPTNTPVPPTSTPMPPTNTPVPPTNTRPKSATDEHARTANEHASATDEHTCAPNQHTAADQHAAAHQHSCARVRSADVGAAALTAGRLSAEQGPAVKRVAADSRDVVVVEVGPRDGLQNEPIPVPTPVKIAFVDALTGAGLPVIEATSFVNPKAVPQLADADELMRGIVRRPGIRYPVLVPNERGYARARAAGVNAIALFTAATEEFAMANVGASIAGTFERFAPVVGAAAEDGAWIRGYVSVAFGCPYAGAVQARQAIAMAERLLEIGCDEICLADTIGVATPGSVREMLQAASSSLPIDRLGLHFHDTGGNALANVAEGLKYGVRIFDSAAGGLGGCPFAPGAPGNLATEELVAMLEQSGLRTGVDVEAVASATSLLRPYVTRLGSVPA